MKAFLLFLSGALLGSIAAWFVWLGQVRPHDPAPQAPLAAPASVPVTQPPPQSAAPQARPAIRREDPGAQPEQMIPVQQPVPGETEPASEANAPMAPVDAKQAVALPPESTPVAPVAAPADALSPPPPDLPPLRPLALVIPVAGVKPAQLLDTYTDARGGGRTHEAIDIMAPRGTPVYAVEDGRVEKLFESKQGGLTVYQFDRDGELAYYYAHLDSYAPGLAEGQALRQGDLVGYVGSTGNANPDGPHLHFAIFRLGPEHKWWKGTPVNPFPFLRNGALKTSDARGR
jgi:murein DD-endopeptidase MepM/ murein hydrolase activator NlpD